MKSRPTQRVPDASAIRVAAIEGLRRITVKHLRRNIIMGLVAVGALITLATTLFQIVLGQPWGSSLAICFWLWFTVWSAMAAESFAEGRGKARASSLRGGREGLKARLLRGDKEYVVDAATLQPGDLIACSAGEVIPVDGEVVAGVAMIDESAITGESAPVLRSSGGDRSAVTGGTTIRSDSVTICVQSAVGHGFVDRLIALIEQANRQPTPNERALSIVLQALTAIFLVVVVTLPLLMWYAGVPANTTTGVVGLVALFVCLIPTTIGGLLPAIGIAGMDRLVARNVVALSGRAIEAAGDVDVLLLDKTGTITYGNRKASEIIPAAGKRHDEIARLAYLASIYDETPEGESIRHLVVDAYGPQEHPQQAADVPFSAHTRLSGIDLPASQSVTQIRKGAVDVIASQCEAAGNPVNEVLLTTASELARKGSTPLLISVDDLSVGLVELRDIVKPGIRDRFERMRQYGIRTVMITGDNPLTAATIAAEAGVDEYIAQARPEDKLERIRFEQVRGNLVAMIGDGTNDAPALAQADVGIAMVSGTQAAREAATMIDLDNDPTKILDVVDVGKELLRTRGALTTFSIANDVSKYVAILPAMFASMWPTLLPTSITEALNVLQLQTPESAILSAVIFNAIVIGLLLPLALRGNRDKGRRPEQMLRKNLLIYGLGGIVAPFPSIKLIDMLISLL